ncbi:DUF2511 domain-containing protein [Mycobacterium ulcerans]|nr:DUF2511 domain-containing protein [Mycobacterium ulcerans]
MATVGCSSDSDVVATSMAPSSSSTGVSARQSTTASVPAQDRPTGYVSRKTWTDGPWPLIIDEAVLDCQGDSLVTITANESTYALNSAAYSQTELPDYAPAIGAHDPDKPGSYLDAGPLIERGLALCGTPATTSTPISGSNRPAGLVERKTWTDGRWPFTVDSATLFCTKPAGPQSERVTVVANHEMYALNGTAQDANLWPAFDPIWRDDPIAPGMKINIGPMIERGLALCEG